MINLENPLMLIAQIYYLTLNARELTRPMCFDLSRDARAAIACRVSFASYVFSALSNCLRVCRVTRDACRSRDARVVCVLGLRCTIIPCTPLFDIN